MSNRFEIFLDTDVYLEHLSRKEKGDSYLVKCLGLFDCYTSVINASEIFAGCSTAKMKERARHSFFGSGILGIPYKYSVRIGDVMNTVKKKIFRSASGMQF